MGLAIQHLWYATIREFDIQRCNLICSEFEMHTFPSKLKPQGQGVKINKNSHSFVCEENVAKGKGSKFFHQTPQSKYGQRNQTHGHDCSMHAPFKSSILNDKGKNAQD
jgi:hypothetical protein